MTIVSVRRFPAPSHTIAEHIGRTLRLALPVMFSRAGILIMTVVDSAMTGRAGAKLLAYYGIAMAPHIFMTLIGLGLLLGTVILTAQAEGAGASEQTGVVWRVALVHAVFYGVVLTLLSYGGEWFLLAVGQSEDLARGGGNAIIIFGWGITGLLLYVTTTLFLEGLGRPLPSLIVMVLANVVNAALNWLFVFGHWGMPAMGADGAVLATTIVRWLMFFALLFYVLRRLDRERYGISGPLLNFWSIARKLRRIGYPMALAQGLESSSFSAMTLFAGLMGAAQVAAYQINMTLIALVFMFALGFSTAASVRVGNAVGRADQPGVRWAGWTAAGLAVLVLALWAIVFFAQPGALVAIYTDDAEVTAIAVSALAVAAFVLVPDGFQSVMMGSLRGIADVWPASILALISFWLVMVPAGYLFGVVWQYGSAGLMGGILIGCISAALLLSLRFHRVSRRAVQRL